MAILGHVSAVTLKNDLDIFQDDDDETPTESAVATDSETDLRASSKKTYFDVTIDGKKQDRIVFSLYDKTVPKTAENFYELCKGDKMDGA